MKRWFAGAAIASVSLLGVAIITAGAEETLQQDANRTSRIDLRNLQDGIAQIRVGKSIFRNDTLGNEAFWGDTLRLHAAIAGSANGGVGAGLSQKQHSRWV